jgi:hypothetical protein
LAKGGRAAKQKNEKSDQRLSHGANTSGELLDNHASTSDFPGQSASQ